MPFFRTNTQSKNLEWGELNWQNSCLDRALPYRGDLSEMNHDFQFLLHKAEKGRPRIRRAGLYFEALFGASLVGREFSSLFTQTQNDVLASELASVFDEPAKVYIDAYAEEIGLRLSLLPVSADYGPVHYAIGTTSLEDLPVKNIVKLNVQAVESVSLAGAKKELKYGFAEDRKGFAGPSARSGFHVIEGGGTSERVQNLGLRIIQHVKREP